MRPEVVLGEGASAVWLSSVAGWGGLKVTDKWGHGGSGCWEASWQMTLPPLRRPRGLSTDVPVRVMVGAVPVFAGRVPDLDWSAGEFSAIGAVRESEEALSLGADGLTTATPNAAVDAAIARGALTWKRRASLSGATIAGDGDETDGLYFVNAVLDAWADGVGKRWAVNARREVYAAADPMVPAFYVMPGAGEFGTATDLMVGKLYGRYQKSGGVLATVTSGAGLPEVPIDLTGRGTLTQVQAQGVLDGIWAKASKVKNFTNAIQVDAAQISRPGSDEPVQPHRVKAGAMVRFLALRDERNGAPHTDVVVGQSEWDSEAGTVTLTPVDTADRDLESFVEDAGGSIVK